MDKTTDNTLGFNNILVDSYEVGCQTWTQGLEKIFERRFGYSLVPYLPALAGRVVGSTGEMCDAPVWRETGGRTMVRLSLARLSSVFVVFRRQSAGVKHFTSFKATLLPQAPVAAAEGSVVVKKALFGTLKRSGSAEEESGEFEPGAVDVTARVASLVASGRAFKATMDDLGCPDPAFGKVKFLRVWYTAGGGERLMIDLGEVLDIAAVRVDGKPPAVRTKHLEEALAGKPRGEPCAGPLRVVREYRLVRLYSAFPFLFPENASA